MASLHTQAKRFGAFTVLSLSLCLTAAPGLFAKGNPNAQPGQASQPQYEIVTEFDVPITMRDGTVLYCDVFRPDAEGQFPVIIEGTPYGKTTSSDLNNLKTAEYFVPRGYVFITRDVRGRYMSEGEFILHTADQNDGYDAVEWAAKQPWANGKVAAVGISYAGQVVLHTAIAQPPSLVCAIPNQTSMDLWREWYYRGGAMELGFISSWAAISFAPDMAQRYLQGDAFTALDDVLALYNADRESFTRVLPLTDFEASRISEDINLFAEWAAHPTDGPYWWNQSPQTYNHEINIPMLHTGGWYDIFLAGTIKAYHQLQETAPSMLARENQRLMIGPWPHGSGNFFRTEFGVVDYGPGLLETNYNDVRLGFLDYWMKDIQSELFDLDNPVLYFKMGENKWHSAPTWPLPEVEYTNYYFCPLPNSSINSLHSGNLLDRMPANNGAIKFENDPANPILTRGGNTLFLFATGDYGLAGQGAQDQRPVEERSVTFTSKPLQSDLEISGKVTAVIYAYSDAVDTDFVVRVSDVAPDGLSLNIVDGIQRARFRTSGLNPTLIEPGEIYEYEIDLWETSYVFPAGHMIRVTVNSSSFPRWSRNLNVAEFPEWATDYTVATNVLRVGPAYPSHVILPVIP